MPRHSPCALSSLTSFWPLCCSHNASSLQQDSKLYLTHRSRFFIFPDALSDISLAFLAFHNYSVFKIPGVHAPHELFPCFRMCFPQTFRFELVGSSGLEPPTSRLSGVRSNHLSYEPISFQALRRPSSLPSSSTHGGDEEVRTPDPLRARQVLSQLSYTPMVNGAAQLLSLHPILKGLGSVLMLSFIVKLPLQVPSKLNNNSTKLFLVLTGTFRLFLSVCSLERR